MQDQCRQQGARDPEGAEQGPGGPRAATAPQAHLLVGQAPGVLLVQDQLHQPF